jgi:type IV pilus assembly protein PilK
MQRAVAAVDAVGQLVMADDQFSKWVRMLEKRTGIVLPSTRRDFLITNLRSRMREIGQTSFDTYYDSLQTGDKSANEWAYLVDRLTVHQTHFFRHPPSFTCIKEWLEARFQRQIDTPVTAWSVGCSTGEEAYSLAMQIEATANAGGQRLQYGVSATDVSQLSLITARKGVYSKSKFKEIPAEIARHFTAEVNAESFEVIEPLRRRVAFSPFNILDLQLAGLKPFDLIFCQNVMIYFPANGVWTC